MDRAKMTQLAKMLTAEDIENDRLGLMNQVAALRKELGDSKSRCTDLERCVELLKCKNAKLELDVNSLRKVDSHF